MSPTSYDRVKTVFLEALARPASEWPAFVAKACGGDADVETKVLALLRFHSDDEDREGLGDDQGHADRVREALKDRYTLQKQLGVGGMATVYLARDLKHDREVAIKVLHPHVARSLGAERFLSEIRITAKLQHPHILPLHDSGEAAGLLYYVMPHAEGESLRDRLEREDRLTVEEAVEIAGSVALALDYAHRQGVVHRDIKPENILLQEGQPVVADFGVALAMSAAGDLRLTAPGTTLGTPLYMSPEQISRGHAIAAQSDIYSLGCVLYEMLGGRPPYADLDAVDIIAKKTTESVRHIGELTEVVPRGVEEALTRALAMRPTDRYDSAADFAEALTARGGTPVSVRPPRGTVRRRWSPRFSKSRLVGATAFGSVAVGLFLAFGSNRSSEAPADGIAGLPAHRIAVLYFDDFSPDQDLAHLGDAFTEALIHDLSQVTDLEVVSRYAVKRFRQGAVPVDSVARALGVGSIVEGSLEQVDSVLRVTVHLISGSTGAHELSSVVEGSGDDLVALRDELVSEVGRLLRGRLGQSVRSAQLRAGTESSVAWELVQRARWNEDRAQELAREDDDRRSLDFLRRADSLVSLATREDPDWVEAHVFHAKLALSQVTLGYPGSDVERPTRDLLDECVRRANRALEISPRHAEALEQRGTAFLYTSGFYRNVDGDRQDSLEAAGMRDLMDSVSEDPRNVTAHMMLSGLHRVQGNFAEARRSADLALTHDEFQVLEEADEGLFALLVGSGGLMGPLEPARKWCDAASRRYPDDPRFVECHLWLMLSDDGDPDIDGAWGLQEAHARMLPEGDRELRSRMSRMLVGGVIWQVGLTDSAAVVIEGARADVDVDPMLMLIQQEAAVRSVVGDTEGALDLLSRFVTVVFPYGYDFEVGDEVRWVWKNLSGNPRFEALRESYQKR